MSFLNSLHADTATKPELVRLRNFANVVNMSNESRQARAALSSRTRDRGGFVARKLFECRHALSQLGFLSYFRLVNAELDRPFEWTELLEQVFFDPISFADIDTWLLFQACLAAQTEFAQTASDFSEHKASVVTTLIERLWYSLEMWSNIRIASCGGIGSAFQLAPIKINRSNSGTNTEAFAIILDLGTYDPLSGGFLLPRVRPASFAKTNYCIPLVFYPVSFDDQTVGVRTFIQQVSIPHDDCNNGAPSYFFLYRKASVGNKEPVLPMVREAGYLSSLWGSHGNILNESVDLATLILRAVTGAAGLIRPSSPDEALNLIFSKCGGFTPSQVIIVSNRGGTVTNYIDVLKKIGRLVKLAEMKTVYPFTLSDW